MDKISKFWARFFYDELFIGDEVEIRKNIGWFCDGAKGTIIQKREGGDYQQRVYRVELLKSQNPDLFKKYSPAPPDFLTAGWFERTELVRV